MGYFGAHVQMIVPASPAARGRLSYPMANCLKCTRGYRNALLNFFRCLLCRWLLGSWTDHHRS